MELHPGRCAVSSAIRLVTVTAATKTCAIKYETNIKRVGGQEGIKTNDRSTVTLHPVFERSLTSLIPLLPSPGRLTERPIKRVCTDGNGGGKAEARAGVAPPSGIIFSTTGLFRAENTLYEHSVSRAFAK